MKKYSLIALSKKPHDSDYYYTIKTWRCYDLEQVRQIKECVATCLSISGYHNNNNNNIEKLNNNTVYTETTTFTNSSTTLILSVLYFSKKHFSNILHEELNDYRA